MRRRERDRGIRLNESQGESGEVVSLNKRIYGSVTNGITCQWD